MKRSTGAGTGREWFEDIRVAARSPVPRSKKIPPLEFSYFDPSKGKYVALKSGAIDLTVEKGSAEAPQIVSGISKEDVKLLSQDIRFIKTNSGSFRKKGGEYSVLDVGDHHDGAAACFRRTCGVPAKNFKGIIGRRIVPIPQSDEDRIKEVKGSKSVIEFGEFGSVLCGNLARALGICFGQTLH